MATKPDGQKRLPVQTASSVLSERYLFYKSWMLVADEVGYNKGSLCGVANGRREASVKLIERMNERIPNCNIAITHTVAVSPLPCGCPPQGTRCKVHGKPRSTTPNATRKRDKRIEAMRAAVKLQQSIYLQS